MTNYARQGTRWLDAYNYIEVISCSLLLVRSECPNVVGSEKRLGV